MCKTIKVLEEPLRAKFALGTVLITRNARETLPEIDTYDALRSHMLGDWGDVSEEDRRANEEALITGARILSVYHSRSGERFWILTEADRSATTIMLPEDY